MKKTTYKIVSGDNILGEFSDGGLAILFEEAVFSKFGSQENIVLSFVKETTEIKENKK